MKICAPLADVNELNPLLDLGVEEIYAGLLTQMWEEKFGLVLSSSRRYGSSAHLKDLRQLQTAVKACDGRGAKFFLTLNERYEEEQFPALLEIIKAAEQLGVKALILGDLGFLLYLREKQILMPLFMGVGGNVFNLQALSLCRELGVSRVILPRQLTLKEIKTFRQTFPYMEMETFIFRGLCPYIDGLCRFWHGINATLGIEQEDLGCGLNYRIKFTTRGRISPELTKRYRQVINHRQSFTGCGLCALWEFHHTGIDSVKIVGREIPGPDKIAGVKVVKKALDIVKQNLLSREEFREFCRESYRKFYRKNCREIACYYPELPAGKSRP